MMKKIATLLLALVLALLSCSAALAQTEGPLFESISLNTSSLKDCDCLIYATASGDGLVTPDGRQITGADYGALFSAGCGYFEFINENGLTTHGLIDSTGAKIIPANYSAFQVYSRQWVGAVVLAMTTDENADYEDWALGDGNRYVVDHVDMWYIPDLKIAGTLDYDSFKQARAVGQGEYLLVSDRSASLSLYDSGFQKLDHGFEYYHDDADFAIRPIDDEHTALFSRITGEKVSDLEVMSVSPINLDDSRYAVLTAYADNFLYGLMNSAGELIMPMSEANVSLVLSDRYVLVSIYDNAMFYGIYDTQAGRMIVPCEYSEIDYFEEEAGFNGYFQVAKDDMCGFVDLEGNVTCPLVYPKDSVYRAFGCSFITKDENGNPSQLVAGDGTVTDISGLGITDSHPRTPGSDGRYISVSNAEGKSAIIDWHGNLVQDFTLSGLVQVYRDGYFCCDGNLYRVVE